MHSTPNWIVSQIECERDNALDERNKIAKQYVDATAVIGCQEIKIEKLEKKLAATLAHLDSMIDNCCAEKVRFCTEYGCASLKMVRDKLRG